MVYYSSPLPFRLLDILTFSFEVCIVGRGVLALKCPVRHDARSPRHILCSAVHLRAHTPHHYKASSWARVIFVVLLWRLCSSNNV